VIVVADAGPLIHLAAIGQLDLVRRVFDAVVIPAAVFQEVVVAGAGLPGSAEVAAARWIEVRSPTREDLVTAFEAGGLHRGEAEAIGLAVEMRAAWLLIDERQGRLTALTLGIGVIGSIGILIAAKSRGDIGAVRPTLTALQRAGVWLSDALIAQVLEAVDENDEV